MGKFDFKAFALGLAGLIVFWTLMLCVFTIDAVERGVILRFRFGAVGRSSFQRDRRRSGVHLRRAMGEGKH